MQALIAILKESYLTNEHHVLEIVDHVLQQLGPRVDLPLEVSVQGVLDVVHRSPEGGQRPGQQLQPRRGRVVQQSHPRGPAVSLAAQRQGGVQTGRLCSLGVRELVIVFQLLHLQQLAHEVGACEVGRR